MAEVTARADAPRHLVPRCFRLTVDVSPDQFPVAFPEAPQQFPRVRALDAMAEAGLAILQTGPFGYFPPAQVRLRKPMPARGITGAGWVTLPQGEAREDAERTTFRPIGQIRAADGDEYVIQ
ncbi:hypothetical protein [Gephyromycinifex aptenodytis]|uniref:hypothetical protein n=1 Tax=Gephyromycinifex aptenodytis TaxID=2716227 RepID=UPI0014462AD4|nr:hypothetical protein [Gephyromycinifex aptenodytis]